MSPAARKMLSAAMMCFLMTSLAGATDIYEDSPPGDLGDILYQEHNYIEPGVGPFLPEMKDDGDMRSLMLYKLLTAMRNQAVSPNILAGPKWIPSGAGMVDPETFDLSLLRGPMMKRGSDVAGMVAKNKPAPQQPARKWKNKKGRSPWICYFKLCAFRRPGSV